MQKIIKASVIYGMGDALNARSFLAEYCKQKDFPKEKVYIYTNKYWWMFEGMGFKRSINDKEFLGLTPFKNFGLYNILKLKENQKLDLCIAENAGIKYTFDTITPLPHYDKPKVKLPKRYITLNTGFGEFSGKVGEDYICTKSWPLEHWNELIKLLDIPCVQIGAGPSCQAVKGVALNLIDKTTIKETCEILRGALFHIDIEGGLPILMQHLGGKSVVLFGSTAIENQGRSFNLNLRANTCNPCYEWGEKRLPLCVKKKDLKCKAHCMSDLKPDYVAEQIYKNKWL